jgi:hypothetical protein
MKSLTIATQPQISVTEPDVISISGYRRSLGGESPTITVTLNNAMGQLTKLFAVPPLRARASVIDAAMTITGIVQSVRLGAVISLDIET